jgi:hypothetical protein
MNIISMMDKIHFVANPMIGEAALPHLALPADDATEFVGICAFDQLDRAFDGYIHRGSQQEVNVFWHENESVKFITAFAAVPIECLEEKAHVGFDDEQFPAVVCREGDEVGSGRGYESSRLQSETSAAGSRESLQTLNWHEWNSCPSRLFFFGVLFVVGKGFGHFEN